MLRLRMLITSQAGTCWFLRVRFSLPLPLRSYRSTHHGEGTLIPTRSGVAEGVRKSELLKPFLLSLDTSKRAVERLVGLMPFFNWHVNYVSDIEYLLGHLLLVMALVHYLDRPSPIEEPTTLGG